MRTLLFFAAMFPVMPLLTAEAMAHPDGAPWGSADPDTMQSCASCHFDHEPIGRSQSLMLTGLPEYATAGDAYQITLRFGARAAAEAGFLLSASSGAFEAIDAFVETRAGEARSSEALKAGEVEWSILWRAADDDADIVTFHAAANAANGDLSEFGDEIHFRKFVIPFTTNEN